MSRYKKSEYRAERRSRLAEKPAVFKKCQGDMGLCNRREALQACPKCGKPYCGDHLKEHPKYCLGMLQ